VNLVNLKSTFHRVPTLTPQPCRIPVAPPPGTANQYSRPETENMQIRFTRFFLFYSRKNFLNFQRFTAKRVRFTIRPRQCLSGNPTIGGRGFEEKGEPCEKRISVSDPADHPGCRRIGSSKRALHMSRRHKNIGRILACHPSHPSGRLLFLPGFFSGIFLGRVRGMGPCDRELNLGVHV